MSSGFEEARQGLDPSPEKQTLCVMSSRFEEARQGLDPAIISLLNRSRNKNISKWDIVRKRVLAPIIQHNKQSVSNMMAMTSMQGSILTLKAVVDENKDLSAVLDCLCRVLTTLQKHVHASVVQPFITLTTGLRGALRKGKRDEAVGAAVAAIMRFVVDGWRNGTKKW